jgi:hypothetical protein
LFFPCAGRRHDSTGAVGLVTSYGYYWSRTPYPYAGYAYSLYFGSSDVYPNYANYRYNGFTVRCLTEFGFTVRCLTE